MTVPSRLTSAALMFALAVACGKKSTTQGKVRGHEEVTLDLLGIYAAAQAQAKTSMDDNGSHDYEVKGYALSGWGTFSKDGSEVLYKWSWGFRANASPPMFAEVPVGRDGSVRSAHLRVTDDQAVDPRLLFTQDDLAGLMSVQDIQSKYSNRVLCNFVLGVYGDGEKPKWQVKFYDDTWGCGGDAVDPATDVVDTTSKANACDSSCATNGDCLSFNCADGQCATNSDDADGAPGDVTSECDGKLKCNGGLCCFKNEGGTDGFCAPPAEVR